MTNSIKNVLIIAIVLLIAFFSVTCKRKGITLDEKEEMNKKNIELSGETDQYVIRLIEVANRIIKKNDESIQSILNKAYETYGHSLENIYFADASGRMLLCPPIYLPEDYDARGRNWYRKALETDLYLPEPYENSANEKRLQTVSKAIYKDNQLIGVIGMEYELTNNSKFANSNVKNERDLIKRNDEDEKSILSQKEKEEMKRYVVNLSKTVESKDNLKTLKDYFEKNIGYNGVKSIYLAKEKKIFITSPYIPLPENYNPNVRSWYELAIEEDIYVSDTYIDSQSNKTMVTVSKKVDLGSDIIGVLGVDFIIDL